MDEKTKKSRKAVHNYIFDNDNDCKVQIDLNSYEVKCSVTGNVKKFYHKYLANMIATKFENNIDTFEQNYVSREAAPSSADRKLEKLEARITRMYNQIRELKAKKAELIAVS